MRDTMIFYRSFYEAIKGIDLEIQAEIYNAIFSYSLDFVEPELTGISNTIWCLIKPQLDANIKRFNNGKKAKQKQNRSKEEAKDKQNESKTKANNNNNNNNNNNVSKPKSVSFEHSKYFDKSVFAKYFSEWNKEKLKYYYEAAVAYSAEGNKYISWELAINKWAKRDELEGKLNFKIESKSARPAGLM